MIKLVDVNDVVGVILQHGKLLGGAYHIRVDDAELLLGLFRRGEYTPLNQAVAHLGADISIVYGTIATSECDIPAFLRKERYDGNGTPIFMTDGERRLRLEHPENYLTHAIVITANDIIER